MFLRKIWYTDTVLRFLKGQFDNNEQIRQQPKKKPKPCGDVDRRDFRRLYDRADGAVFLNCHAAGGSTDGPADRKRCADR